jgi:pilus assembly protein CpaD
MRPDMTLRTPRNLAVLTVAAATLALSACGGGSSVITPLTPISQYYMQVEPGLDRIALAVHDAGMSANQAAAIDALVQRYWATGVGGVIIQAPAGGDAAASDLAWSVKSALSARGVPEERIRVEGYSAADPRAPVLVGFDIVQAVIPNCSAVNGQGRPRYTNAPSPGLGCAVTANMAAQIDDPRDIQRPRAMTPADSGRAAVVFQNYRAGQPTSAPQDELVSGRIARAVE